MLRRRSRPVLAALLALAVGGPACERGTPAPTATPSDGSPSTPAPVVPLGDTSAAYEGHGGAALQPTTPRTRPTPTAVDSLEAAIKAATSGNPEAARDFLTGHLEKEPKDLDSRTALARAYLQLGESAAALQVLDDAPPQDVLSLRLRAEAHRRAGKHALAIAGLRTAVKQQPGAMALRGDLVSLMVETGTEPAAASALMDGLYDDYEADRAKTPADLFAVAQAALGRGTKGALHDANMVFGEAEELAAQDAPLGWDLEAIVLMRADMFRRKYAADDALQTYALILGAHNPWHADALAGSARVHADNLSFADATRLAQEALLVDPGHPTAHGVLARVALIEGRREEAHKRVETHVLARDGRDPTGLAVMAALALVRNEPETYQSVRTRALGANPHNGEFYRSLADILGFLHLYPEAAEVLDDGVAQAPKDPVVRAARGLNLLRLGREAEAREDLGAAWKRDPFNERTRNTLDLYEQTIDTAYAERTVGKIVVRLPKEDQAVLESVLVDSAVRSRKALDEAYKTKVGTLRLEFFSDPAHFSVRTVGVPSLGALAVCFGPVVTFIGPYAGRFNMDNVIRHELSHTYAIKLSRGRVPRWFTEGLSEWESELADPAFARESAALLTSARRLGKLRRLGELELAFIRAESPQMMEVAYATAAYAVRYLGTTYGRDALIAMLRGYAKGQHTEALMQAHLGKPLATVEKEFEAWFFAQLDGVVSGWQPADDEASQDKRDTLFGQARAALEKEDQAAATAALEALIAADGDGFAPRMLLAKLTASTPAKATGHLEAARGFNTEALEPLVMLADQARRDSRSDDEKRYLAQAMAIDGDAFEPAARLMMLAAVTADTKAMTLARSRAMAVAPLHPGSLAARALAHAKKDPALAKRLLAAATTLLESAEGPADTFVIAALSADALGQRELAKTLAKRAVALGNLPEAALRRIEVLAQ